MNKLIQQINNDKLQLANEFLLLKESLANNSSVIKTVTQCKCIVDLYDRLQLKESILDEIR